MKRVVEELYKKQSNEIDLKMLIIALSDKKIDFNSMYENIKQDTA